MNRRNFIKGIATATASLALPKSSYAQDPFKKTEEDYKKEKFEIDKDFEQGKEAIEIEWENGRAYIKNEFEKEKNEINEYFNDFQKKLSQEVDKRKRINKELTEQDKIELAYQTFDAIMQIPNQPNAKNEIQNNYFKKQVASAYVYTFADQITDQNRKVTPKERMVALEYLFSPSVSQRIADKYAGNNDGQFDFEEINRLNTSIKKYPGLEEITNMYYNTAKVIQIINKK